MHEVTPGDARPGPAAPPRRCLLLGGAGPVGTAALYLMKKLGWRASVVDPVRPPHGQYHAAHLAGTLEDWTEKLCTLDDLRGRLAKDHFDLVIDLTPTLDKRESILLCDAMGVSLVNSTMVDYKDDIHIAAFNFLDRRPPATRCPHIVATGMNPGAVNAMAEEIIAAYDQPDAIVYWEYDDTLPCDGVLAGPSTTWSQGEAGDEMTEDWTFEVVEEGTVILHEDALSWHPQNFASCGVPVEALGIPADAGPMLIGHEECVYMGWRHDTAAKFVYGFHPENMRLIRSAGYGWRPHLLVHDPVRPLVGRDVVGVACRYVADDTWVGSYCQLANAPDAPPDTNATCHLVASGVIASAICLAQTRVKPGVYLTHEVPGWMKYFRGLADVHRYVMDGDGRVSLLGCHAGHELLEKPVPPSDGNGTGKRPGKKKAPRARRAKTG
ncbi:MAG: hypothetical protein ABR915_25755 [Thermoguttaceae bacterium]